MGISLKGSVPLHLILIAVLGLLAYSNTFHAPFQWDEEYFIEDNPIVKDLNYFLEPSKAKGLELYSTLKGRYIGYLTFALNYKLHGLNVTGYHIFNLAIHILNALLVYFLVILTFRTPFLSGSTLKEHSEYIAFFTSLLFVSHPVQTEAVTYIFQRLASLMAFFYLLSLAAYIGSRLSTRNTSRYALYALSLISAVLAMKTKENAFTLPLIIMLYEFLFLSSPIKLRVLRLIPLLLTLLIVPLTLTGIDRPPGEIIGSIGSETRGYETISRGDYLFTQFRVVVTYIRLLFLPVNQNIDYDYPVLHSFSTPSVFLSFLFLLSILGCAVYLLFRSIFRNPDLRLISIGIFWFFITLSIESSIIPIPMVINEYRAYLPSAGFFMATTAAAFLLLGKLKNKKVHIIASSSFIMIPLVFSYAAYARNSVWESKISLWEDAARKATEKPGVHLSLGNAYRDEGLYDKAIKHYRTAVRLKPDYAEAHNNLGITYMSARLIDKAMEHLKTAVRLKPDYAMAHCNLGNAYRSKGLTDKAGEHYQIALRLKPDFVMAHNNLSVIYKSKGLFDKAIEHLRIALRLKPDFVMAHNNLGVIYKSKGLFDKAIEQYRIALRLKPDFVMVHLNLGLAYLEKGSMEEARREFETALQINPDYRKARRYLNRMNKMGQ